MPKRSSGQLPFYKVDDPPRLATATLLREQVADWERYPFGVPVIRALNALEFRCRVCFFVGENGSGKSTLLEAIAEKAGLGREGGSQNIRLQTTETSGAISPLSAALRLSWRAKLTRGFFLRAESFFNIASYVDDLGYLEAYGGKSLHEQSHGESFLALLENRFFANGFYVLDEPEAALSPQRQLNLLLVLHRLITTSKDTQFIIASHSPIVLSYPGAQIVSFDGQTIEDIAYEQTQPYQIMRSFVNNPERTLRELFRETES